jgi:hypothetical protein
MQQRQEQERQAAVDAATTAGGSGVLRSDAGVHLGVLTQQQNNWQPRTSNACVPQYPATSVCNAAATPAQQQHQYPRLSSSGMRRNNSSISGLNSNNSSTRLSSSSVDATTATSAASFTANTTDLPTVDPQIRKLHPGSISRSKEGYLQQQQQQQPRSRRRPWPD